MIERIIFECEHCHKARFLTKKSIINHEHNCWYNTKNKTCLTCKFNDSYSINGHRISECAKEGKEIKHKPIVNCENYEEGNFIDYLEEQRNE